MTLLLKRFVGRREQPDGELLRLKTELSNVTTALEAAVCGLEALSEDTTRLYASVQRFSTDFHSLYPSDDGVRRLGAAAVDSAGRLDVGASPHVGRVADLERGVRAYLAEIRNLQKELRAVNVARREAEVATLRADRLEARRPDDDKCLVARRNADDRSQAYTRLAGALRKRLRSTHDKHARVFQQVYTAYMLRLDGNVRVLERNTRAHRLHAIKLDNTTASNVNSLSKQQSWHAGDLV